MIELDDVRPLGRDHLGLSTFSVGDGERWLVGDHDEVCAAIGRAVIDALSRPDGALGAPLGPHVAALARAAAEPEARELGLVVLRVA